MPYTGKGTVSSITLLVSTQPALLISFQVSLLHWLISVTLKVFPGTGLGLALKLFNQ
jgi:hypothetical protein